MVIAGIELVDKLDRAQFIQKTFLLAKASMELILEMTWLTFTNMHI